MKTLEGIKKNIKNRSNYRTRKASRAVLLDEDDNMALLHATKNNYFKLPGGGVEDEEDLKITLKRELKEETGCRCKVLAEVGKIIEYRDEAKLKQTSFCYLARVDGEKGIPDFTEKEKNNGFELMWIDINEAIKLTEKDNLKRDSIFIKEARELLKLNNEK